jgi:hypothetical protein
MKIPKTNLLMVVGNFVKMESVVQDVASEFELPTQFFPCQAKPFGHLYMQLGFCLIF